MYESLSLKKGSLFVRSHQRCSNTAAVPLFISFVSKVNLHGELLLIQSPVRMLKLGSVDS